jgi:trk system potassium uptake protein TrkA
MHFVIVGFGRVGMRTARVLREEGHDVTVVDVDANKAERAREEGFETVLGDCTDEDALDAAGIETAEAVAGLTGDLNANFAACMIANHHGCRTVMRIDEDYREEIYQQYAEEVDQVIYPERLGAIGAKNALLGGSIQAIADIAQNLQVVMITITKQSPMRGYSIEEVELPAQSRVLAFGKADGPMSIPLEDDSLEAGDRLAVLADFDVLGDVRRLLIGQEEPPTAGGE